MNIRRHELRSQRLAQQHGRVSINEHGDVRLPNPERSWERSLELTSIDPFEVTSRIGMSHAAVELLSGGLANQNLRVGADRVLRIFRRDRRTAAKEAAAGPALMDSHS